MMATKIDTENTDAAKAERDKLAAEALAAAAGSKVEDEGEDSEVEDQEDEDTTDTDSDDSDSQEETDEDSDDDEDEDDDELTELEKAQAELALWKKRARANERKLKKTPKAEEKVEKTGDLAALEARLAAFERKETISTLATEHNLSKEALDILADVPADKLEATAKRLAAFSTKKRGTTFQGKEPETVNLDKASLAAKALAEMAR